MARMRAQDFDFLTLGHHRASLRCLRRCKSQADPAYNYFKHKRPQQRLWVDGWHDPWGEEQASAATLLALLRACAKNKDLCQGNRLHDHILKRGLLERCSNALVSMYASYGALSKAQELFDICKSRDIFTWTALIAGYARNGQGKEALTCFERMQQEGLPPTDVTFACVLKACGSIRALDKGEQIHEEIAWQGLLGNNVKLGTALVGMYAKCGALAKARRVLEELPVRDSISWNTLIAGHVENAEAEQALHCFEHMKREGLSPDSVTYACILKACGSMAALCKGEEIHKEISEQGLLGSDVVLGNALVDMYAKCGALVKARQVLKVLPVRNAISWNALITGYVEHGEDEQALNCFWQMRHEGLSPDAVTFSCALKACGSLGAADKGEKLHHEIAQLGLLGGHVKLGTALIDMYVKCGALKKAQEVLEELPVRNVVSWNALVAGYTQHGRGDKALECFQQMQREDISPDAVTLACILKVCGSIGAFVRGEQIHEDIAKQELLGTNVVLGNALVYMYAKCGALSKAHQVLEELPVRDAMSWHALIAGYADHGRCEQAFNYFEQMQCEGYAPNVATFLCIMKACSSIGAVDKGESIHEEMAKHGLLNNNIVLSNAVVDMYAKCGAFAKARQVLDELPVPDVTSWNALIAGYAEYGECKLALNCFEKMEQDGLSPDAVSFTCILKACGIIGAVDKGVKVHDRIAQLGLLEGNLKLGNTLVGMYAKCGDLAKARGVLEDLPIRDVISWNALIAGCAEYGEGEQALNSFEKMQCEGISPDVVTYACILKACGIVGALAKGEEIHDEIARQGLLENNVILGTALLDMYAKCGALAKAQQILAELPVWDVISWNALMAGSIQQGEGVRALDCFYQMQHEGLSPNASTFSCVLNACSHLGFVDKAIKIFRNMNTKYGLKPDFEHYACMVDVFGRTGHFDKALQVIEEVSSAKKGVWYALLGACCIWGDVNLGRWAFGRTLEVDQGDPAIYSPKVNIDAASRRQDGPGSFTRTGVETKSCGVDEEHYLSDNMHLMLTPNNRPQGHNWQDSWVSHDCHSAASRALEVGKGKSLLKDSSSSHNFSVGLIVCVCAYLV